MKQKYSWLFILVASGALALQTAGVVADAQEKAGSFFGVMAPPSAGVSTTNVSCEGKNDGEIRITATGAAPLSYSLNGGAFQPESVFSGLAVGKYTVTVRDNNGETSVRNVRLKLVSNIGITPVAGDDDGGAICRSTPLVFSGATLLSNDTDPEGKALRIAGVPEAANGTVVTNADGTFTYTPHAGFSGRDSITYTIQKVEPTALVAFTNGHFYEYVPITTSWTNARNTAGNRTYNGMRGYLVTVGSAEENEFIRPKLATAAWMGASDTETEGVWKWVTGPEAGTHFSTGKTAGSCENLVINTAPALPGHYANWSIGEPNNCTGSEHYAHFFSNGTWNDLNVSNSNIKGYVVEYGGLETCPAPTSATGVVFVEVKPSPVVEVEALGVTCAGGPTGQITVKVPAGTGTFTYSLDNGPYVANNVFAGLASGTHTVRIKGSNGCESDPSTVELGTRPDVARPTITAPASVTATTTTACTATGVALGMPVTADDCIVANVANDAPAAFPLGTTTVTWTVTDGAGNTATATQTVVVSDNIAPTAVAKNVEVYLSPDGTATVAAAEVNDGSTDNCGIASLALSQTAFNTTHVGPNTVTLTVTDNGTNTATATATVTVKKRTVSLAYSGSTTGQYSDQTLIGATLLDGLTQAPLVGKPIFINLGGESAPVPTNAAGQVGGVVMLTLAPGTYPGAYAFAGDGVYEAASGTTNFVVTPEDARLAYTGPITTTTTPENLSQATIALTATVRDITAVPTDPAYDAYPGDIALANFYFKVVETDQEIPATLTYADPADKRTATATANWTAELGSDNSKVYTIRLLVGGANSHYRRDDQSDNATLTVNRAIVTGVRKEMVSRVSFSGYPNPFAGAAQIEFTLPTGQEYTLELFDMNGRKVQRLQAGKAEGGQLYKVPVEAGQLPQGIYLARLVTADQVHSLKLILRK